jgi:transposase
MINSRNINIKNLDHLGIVAGLIDKIELVDVINNIVGIAPDEKITTGEVVKAMLLNGLGFVTSPLYLFAEFFSGKAIKHLMGESIEPEWLNDDKLG